jgi:hypothetical protein
MHVHSTGHNATQVVTQTGTVAATAQSAGDGQGISSGVRPADRVDLSPAAQAMLDGSVDSAGPGKSGLSPAHRARALIASQPDLANMSFGMVVSGLVHGTLSLQPAAVETTTDQTADSTDPTTGPVGTDTTNNVGTGSSSSDAVAGGTDNTSSGASQTTTTPDSTSPANGNDSSTLVTDIVLPASTIDTESMLLDALTNTNQDSTTAGTISANPIRS